MLLTIAILSGIGFILSIIENSNNGKLDVNLLMATILVLSTWQGCLPLSIIIIVITFVIGIIGIIKN